MTPEDFDALNGRVLALSVALTSIIPTLSRLGAARAAANLKMEQETLRLEDKELGTPTAEIRSRDLMLDGYLNLLSAVAENGQ